MRKFIILAAVAAFLLAACGGSDDAEVVAEPEATEAAEATAAPEAAEATAAPEPTEEPDTTAAPETCSLSVEQIGDDTMEVLGSYLIDGEDLTCSPTDDALDTFAIYTDLIPADYRNGVIAFVAIDQETSGGTDGAMQDVWGPDGDPTGERYLALDISGSSVELERTIVHEVGHSIFITAGSDVPTDYTLDFNEQFPPGGLYEETPDEFVTEYAASVPDGSEDMAESWAMFVFGDTDLAGDADDDGEIDVVEPGSLAADKVAFFEAYPELVELRDAIRANAGF